jgi:hypothetical protein
LGFSLVSFSGLPQRSETRDPSRQPLLVTLRSGPERRLPFRGLLLVLGALLSLVVTARCPLPTLEVPLCHQPMLRIHVSAQLVASTSITVFDLPATSTDTASPVPASAQSSNSGRGGPGMAISDRPPGISPLTRALLHPESRTLLLGSKRAKSTMSLRTRTGGLPVIGHQGGPVTPMPNSHVPTALAGLSWALLCGLTWRRCHWTG